jgi:hypothetical protein
MQNSPPRPFSGRLELLYRLAQTFNSSLPELLEQTITRLLCKNLEDRPADAVEVKQSLALLMNGPLVITSPVNTESLVGQLPRGILVGREKDLTEAKAL